AIVTGGAQGIGEAIVRKLCREEAHVAFFDCDGDRGTSTATATAAEFPDRPPIFTLCDITAAKEVDQAVRNVLAQFDKIDVLVNNAGVAAYFDAAEMSEEDW